MDENAHVKIEIDAQRDKGMYSNQGYTVAWSDL